MTRSAFLLAAAAVALTGCDYTGDWLFPESTDVPGILDLGTLEPVTVSDLSLDEPVAEDLPIPPR